jgi:hypothetical protein
MEKDSFNAIETLLASTNPEEIRQGLELVRNEIARIGVSEAKPLFEMISTLFYIDPFDRPDLVPVLDEATSLAAGFAVWVIPVLVEQLDAGDVKAQMAAAQSLGRIGDEAIKPLMDAYKASAEPSRRAFVLYALGKVKSAQVVQAAHLALEAVQSPDLELRDTATRVIGKFAECIPTLHIPNEVRLGFIEKLQHNLADPHAGIRAKAIRSLGKLARYGHLKIEEREKLKATCLLILGEDENFEWDRAYVVRKEAKEALNYV